MCTGAEIAIGIGIGTKILGGIVQGNATKQAAEAQARIDEQNAAVADMASADAVSRGRTQETVSRLKGGERIAAQTAGYAASGVDVQSGSAQDVEAATALTNELDAQMIRANAAREAWGYRTQAGQFRLRAQLARQTGQALGNEQILAGVTGGATYGLPLLHIGGTGGGNIPYGASGYDYNGQTYYAGYEG